MTATHTPASVETSSGSGICNHIHDFKSPVSTAECGLPATIVEDLVCRHLFDGGSMDIGALSERTALPSRLLDEVIQTIRSDGRLEVLAPVSNSNAIRYNLTDHGKNFAHQARNRSSYTGPAPISEKHYCQLIQRQSVHDLRITRHDMEAAYADLVIEPNLLDSLGTALHSGKALFIHGPAGTGKTFLCSRLVRLLSSPVYIPHAVLVGDSIVRVFDPSVHQPVPTENAGSQSLLFSDRVDSRLVLCERPFIASGGELTMDMLEVQRDPATRQYLAPLHMKAVHGIYMIDDLGRQRMTTDELFNRWIVPMESGIDYLSLDSGARLELPFDVILIFSTNLSPKDLDDPAFQRRVGHKIGFDYLGASLYSRIWHQECERHALPVDPALIDFAIKDLHETHDRPMLACHPRDLTNMAVDYSLYAQGEKQLTRRGLELAWKNYFAD